MTAPKLLLLEVPATSVLDSLISILIILMILSLITEKLVELVKKYIKVSDKINRWRWLKNINVDTYGKPELAREKKREVTLLAVLLGTLVSLFTKASFFDLLRASNPQEALFWQNEQGTIESWASVCAYLSGSFLIGILITGFFLSFGSAFFHDLLEFLYYVKQARGKLSTPETYKQGSLSETHEFIHTPDILLARRALEVHEDELKSKYQGIIKHLEVGATAKGQIGLIATLSAPTPIDFPTSIPIKMPSGREHQVAVENIVAETAQIQVGINLKLENRNFVGFRGAVGGILISPDTNSKLLLTCSHVVTGGTSDDLGGNIADQGLNIPIRVLEFGQPITLGNLFYARLDEKNDTALVEVGGLTDWSNELPDGNFLSSARSLAEEKDLNSKVRFHSPISGQEEKGVIHKVKSTDVVTFEYDDLTVKDFTGLIVIGNNNNGRWSTISEKGDSGALLYDKDYHPIGLLIGGNDQFTFALPLVPILRQANAHLLQASSV